MVMNIFDFIIFQQMTFPTECGIMFVTLLGALIWTGIICLFHGWPTQKIIYTKHDAPYYPDRNYSISGTLKDEMEADKERAARIQTGLRKCATFIQRHPWEILTVSVIGLILLVIL